MVFTRKKDTEIRKAWKTNASGEKEKVLFVIGKVGELLKMQIIFDDNTAENLDKWLVISADDYSAEEFDNLADAKKWAMDHE